MPLLILLLATLLCSISNGYAQTPPKDIEAELEARLKDKVVNLKVFPSGSSLHFDVQGNLTKGGKLGSWTVYSGQLITRITIKQSLLRVDGERIIYVAQKGAMQLSAMRTGLNRYIEIDLPSNLSLAAAAQALANIFAGTEGLGPYVPDFWKRYMLRQSGQSTEISECDRQATGGGSTPNTPAAPITTGSTPSTVIASQLIKQIRPRYAEEAKQFRIQGVVFLDAIISETGDISEVHVARPVGGSLEETAIEAVRQWKYSPTLQDGRPVWVWTCLTVNYEFR